MKRHAWVLSTALSFTSISYAQIDEDEINERFEALEDFAIEIESKMGHKGIVNSLDSIEAELGGSLIARYQRYETDTDSINYFDGPLVYLTFNAKPAERWNIHIGHAIGQGIDVESGIAESLPTSSSNPGLGLNTFQTTFSTQAQGCIADILDNGMLDTTNCTDVQATAGGITNGDVRGPGSIGTGQLQDPAITQDLNVSVRAFIEYRHNNALQVQMGRMTTPLGLLTREFYPQTFAVAGYPTFSDVLVGTGFTYGTFFNGINFKGKFSPQENQIITYNAFHGKFIDPFSTDDSGNSQPLEVKDQTGARVSWGLSDQTLDIGLNYMHGRREDFLGGNDFDLFGLDFFFDSKIFQARFEYFKSNEGDVRGFGESNSVLPALLGVPVGGNMPDREGWYFEPVFHLNSKLDLALRYDEFEIGSLPSSTIDNANALLNGLNAALSATPLPQVNLDVNLNPYPFVGKIIEPNIALIYRPASGVKITAGANRRIYKDVSDLEVDATYLAIDVSF